MSAAAETPAATGVDAIRLLQRLVRTQSFSAREEACAAALEAWLQGRGARVRRVGANVICEKGTGERGLLLNSHIDTVNIAPGYTRDPFGGEVEGDRLYGLGSTDAKSCVAAMAAAFVALPDPGPRGRLVFAATAEEETGGRGEGGSGSSGLESVIDDLLPLAGAVVGEPTELAICTGQRGMVKLVLHAEGRSGHASRPWEGVNAIEIAATDVVALMALAERLADEGRDPVLGPPTLQATVIDGGTASNVIPGRCEVMLDLRTTPRAGNEASIRAVMEVVRSRVEVRSSRYLAVATDAGEAVVRAATAALPEAEIKAFGGVSDLFFVKRAGVPGVLIGPGSGKQSHQADEFVSVAMVQRAAAAYGRLAEAFFAAAAAGPGPRAAEPNGKSTAGGAAEAIAEAAAEGEA